MTKLGVTQLLGNYFCVSRSIIKVSSKFVKYRKGSVVAEFELIFTKDVEDPFKPLQEEIISSGHLVNMSMETRTSAGQLYNSDTNMFRNCNFLQCRAYHACHYNSSAITLQRLMTLLPKLLRFGN